MFIRTYCIVENRQKSLLIFESRCRFVQIMLIHRYICIHINEIVENARARHRKNKIRDDEAITRSYCTAAVPWLAGRWTMSQIYAFAARAQLPHLAPPTLHSQPCVSVCTQNKTMGSSWVVLVLRKPPPCPCRRSQNNALRRAFDPNTKHTTNRVVTVSIIYYI